MINLHLILSGLVIIAPLTLSLILAFCRKSEAVCFYLSLFVSTVVCLSSIGLVFLSCNGASQELMFFSQALIVEKIKFMSFKFDCLSSLMSLLTSLISTLCIIVSRNKIGDSVHRFYISIALLLFAIVSFFGAYDIITFYIFFEFSLVPMFVMIITWGSKNKIYAATKLFIYTFFGSLFFLVAMIYLVIQSQSTYMPDIISTIQNQDRNIRIALMISMLLCMLIKIPIFPFHTWLPIAHVEAPMAASAILAGVIIKMGSYGIIKIILPAFHSLFTQDVCTIGFIVGVAGVVYASLVAWRQSDVKRIIAYSSISHMGYVIIGIFSLNRDGFSSAIMQMISHGLISVGLFFCIGIIYHQTHTRNISDYGGLASVAPRYSILFTVLTMANIGLPGTSGFVGEFLSICSIVKDHMIIGVILAGGTVLSALYMLNMLRLFLFGEPKFTKDKITDLSVSEFTVLALIAILVIYLGMHPKIIINENVIGNIVHDLGLSDFLANADEVLYEFN